MVDCVYMYRCMNIDDKWKYEYMCSCVMGAHMYDMHICMYVCLNA